MVIVVVDVEEEDEVDDIVAAAADGADIAAAAAVVLAAVFEIDTLYVAVQTDIPQVAKVQVIEVVNGDLYAYYDSEALTFEVVVWKLVQVLK